MPRDSLEERHKARDDEGLFCVRGAGGVSGDAREGGVDVPQGGDFVCVGEIGAGDWAATAGGGRGGGVEGCFGEVVGE